MRVPNRERRNQPVLAILDTQTGAWDSRQLGPMSISSSIEMVSAARLQWLALSLTPGLGATRGKRLVEFFGGVSRIFHASLTELEATGMQAVSAQAIANGTSLELAHEELARAADAGARLVTLEDSDYPSRLRQIYDPPLVLYVRGDVSLLSGPALAIVGTRHPTPYGAGMAERLACDLAARNVVIVSGMARGVDSCAHRGALAGRGKTVAIFGTGVDVIYPRENQRLSDQILATGGALVSEFPLATFAAPQNFPIRNRIISGICFGVLVVEAGEYSGTRITARCALEQNREVFAVPGNVTNRGSWGPNTLIKQGAKLVATWEDVWEELPEDVHSQLGPSAVESKPPATASLFSDEPLAPHEKRILAHLRADEAMHIDELVERLELELSPSEIFAALFELELAGKVRQLPGKNFVKSF
jgi:DNA processing protein